MSGDAVFAAHDVTYTYAGRDRPAVDGIELRVGEGEMVALLGPNGSGKSTLLRLLLAALRPDRGTVELWGRDIRAWDRAEIARRVGVVPQSEELAFPITVRDMVAMGRYPYLGAWRRESAADGIAISRAMERCRIDELARRSVLELSGGERQRVRVARALAQEPRALLLDEPTASLDIAHEMSLFELLAVLRSERVTIVIVTHNLNVAARYADRLVLLDTGRTAAAGRPVDVLTRETVERVYEWPVAIGTADGAPQVVPLKLNHTTPIERQT